MFQQTAPLDVSVTAVLLIVAAAVVLCIPRVIWSYFGVYITLVHELGHAFAALLTGRVLAGIRVHRNQSGTTHSSGRGGFSGVFSGFFGYPAPAMVGAALVWSVFQGYTAAALAVGGVILVLTLVFIRNLFGVLVVLVSAAVSVLLWVYAPPEVQGYALLVLGTALIVGAVRAYLNVVSVHVSRRGELRSSDAYLLYQRSHIPSPIWLLLFAAVIALSIFVAFSAYVSTL
ncbi:M50 family metallopeptidase [Glaciihabitans sp. dw_435]|uniref:M50 family metallopeptidase n=1 Tax=Glaciihabitans sp. dw_435 TaxID=2720081 RepID=UPI001BD5EFAE|nr:M50 family metallopeptidase [Glaciihabitans sp. dw_435]